MRDIHFKDANGKVLARIKNSSGQNTTWPKEHSDIVQTDKLDLEAGERIVGIRGDKNYQWKCNRGYWQSLEFLIADGKGHERSHQAFMRPKGTVNSLPEGHVCEDQENGDEAGSSDTNVVYTQEIEPKKEVLTTTPKPSVILRSIVGGGNPDPAFTNHSFSFDAQTQLFNFWSWWKPDGQNDAELWGGWKKKLEPTDWLRCPISIKFLAEVPPPSKQFGMSIQGEIHNEWVKQCKPDKWCDIVVHDNANGGDNDMIKLMFNSMGGPRQLQIRHFECGVYD